MLKWIKKKIFGKEEAEEKLEEEIAQEEIEAAEEVEELEVSQTEAEEPRSEKPEEKEEPIQEEIELVEEVEESEVSQAEVEDLGPEKLEEKEEPIQEEIEAAEEAEESEVSQTEAEEPRPEKPEEKEESLEEEVEETGKKLGFFEKLKQGLTKTRDNLTEQISSVIKSYQKVDEELFEDLEEILITADVGIETTMDLIDNLRDRVKEEKVNEPEEVMGLLKSEIEKIMLRDDLDHEMKLDPAPAVILVVGVNGVGKTTTIGKMAARYKKEGKKVLIAAGDTFRAAAIEQLEEWGNRAGVDIISHSEGADPAAVIYDGIQAAKARDVDLLICDTAGRLHNKENLMNELNKIFRVLERDYGEASKEVLLVLDATTGQNAMSQAKQFKEVANITGIALTKLDGTAKGGVVIALQSELGVPIKFIGVGEGIDDLQVFDAGNFIEAIFSK